MWLTDSLIKSVEDAEVRVFYVPFAATRLWAQERAPGEPLVFSGWYWCLGPREAGPFKSRSGAVRDAWFRVVRRRPPPGVTKRTQAFESARQTAANKATAGRSRRREAAIAEVVR